MCRIKEREIFPVELQCFGTAQSTKVSVRLSLANERKTGVGRLGGAEPFVIRSVDFSRLI